MFKIEWTEGRGPGSHLQTHAQRDALHESDLLLFPKLSTPLLGQIIQRACELKQIRLELGSRDGV